MNVIAVVPAWNEGSRIKEVVSAVRAHADGVVVVDDGSRDRTGDEARAGGAVVLRHAINRGQGAALRTGTEAALRLGADIVVHLDADGQHDPAMIRTLVAPIAAGEADVVFGSRFLGTNPVGMPWIRKAYFQLARLFNRYVVGVRGIVTDPQSGARAMSREVAMKIDFRQDRAAHCSEILRLVTHSDLRWKEVPVRVTYTAETLRKGQKFSEAFRILWQLIIRG
jgi:polyprenyl-phospho-N-acetylgalactosaminyl synthase